MNDETVGTEEEVVEDVPAVEDAPTEDAPVEDVPTPEVETPEVLHVGG